MIKKIILPVLCLTLLYMTLGIIFNKDIFIDYTKWRFGKEQKVKQEAEVKGYIVLYNKILTDLYVSDGQTLRLNDFPGSKRLRHELYRDIDFMRSWGLFLVYDMADLVFTEIKMITPLTAEVTTFEEWNYIYQKSPSREPAQSIKGLGQGFKYFLEKKKGQWVVADYRPVDIARPDKKDEFKF